MKNERTFVIIKPDGVQRSLIGEVIGRFERIGLKLVGMKMVLPTEEMAKKHYTLDPEWVRKVGEKSIANYGKKGLTPPSNDPLEIGNKVLGNLINYMTSGPVVAMAWQGAHAVGIVRKIVGGTEPLTGDFVLDSYQISDADGRAVRNIIHASGSVDEAKGEIDLWFNDKEIIKYRHIQDAILYDVDLDGILE
ncbi:MAG: nucleoside-diphosphate kinase [Candidatus Taylorbacteria bacterium]|nr:nucleoside-diphosphate kinase [Candidatus Taylorbacteria bacterium]